MANQFINLPALAANGPGAWVDASTFGALKTITVEPNGHVFSPFITIECSNQDAPTVGYPIATFQQAKDQTFEVACHWMRAVTSNYKGGGAPAVAVGGTADGTTSGQLAVPIGDGRGAAVDVSALENLKTVQVAGRFGGTINVLVSEDGGASYNNAFSFQGGPGTAFQTLLLVADFMRVERVGVPLVAPGQPVVWVSATAGGGGGGGGGSLVVTDNTTTVDPTSTLVFDPTSGFAVTDEGGGVAQVSLTSTAFPFPVTARYTVSGLEPDLGDFTIDLTGIGIPQATANYNSFVNLGGVTNIVGVDVVQADNAPTSIHVVGGPFTAGDVLAILLVPYVAV